MSLLTPPPQGDDEKGRGCVFAVAFAIGVIILLGGLCIGIGMINF